MIDINTALQNILKAIYGKEVRQSIHDAISQINDNANEAVDLSQIEFGTDITEPTSPVEGYIEGKIYINVQTGIIWRLEGGSWTDKGHLKSISEITGPVTDVLKDTYTIVFNDGSIFDYIINNGKGIVSVLKVSSDVLEDTYKIEFNDGDETYFTVTNGKGIESITLKETNVLEDTYEITFNNGETQEYRVNNGRGIARIEKTGTNVLEDTYTIYFNDNSTYSFKVTNGKGITSVEKTGTKDLEDIYTITFNNGDTQKFSVFNGARGDDGISIKDVILYSTVGKTRNYKIQLSDETYTQNGFVVNDGESSYLHVRYSATFDGQNMVSTPTKNTPYIGMVVTTMNTAPTDASLYKWVKFIGDSGEGSGDMLTTDFVTIYPGTKIVDKAAALWDGEKEIHGDDMMQITKYASNGNEGVVDKAAMLVDLDNGKEADSAVLANLTEEDGKLKYKGQSIGEVDDAFNKESVNPVQNKIVATEIETIENSIGNLEDLETEEKENIVGAVNEVVAAVEENTDRLSEVNETLSDNADYLKSANLFDFNLFNAWTTSIQTITLKGKPNTSYTLSSNVPLASDGYANLFIKNTDYEVSNGKPKTITTDSSGNIDILYRNRNNAVPTPSSYWYMLNEGTEALPYTQYRESNVDLTAKLSDNTNNGFLMSGNVWNEEWEQGHFNSDGEKINYAGKIRSKEYIPIKPNSYYRIKKPVGLNMYFYDSNKNFVKFVEMSDDFFKTEDSWKYMMFSTFGSSISTYNGDIAFYEGGKSNVEITEEFSTVKNGGDITIGTLTATIKTWGKVAMLRFYNGYVTTTANTRIGAVPNEYLPADTIDFVESYGNKRMQIKTTGEVVCSSDLSGTAIRGTVMYILK